MIPYFTKQIKTFKFNMETQKSFLKSLSYQEEFEVFMKKQDNVTDYDLKFTLNNGSFGSGDAEFLFNMMNRYKPKNIIEIGCGQSTLIIQGAMQAYSNNAATRHICIEPYEQPWLERLTNLDIRRPLEDLDERFFDLLGDGDLLFIDSSHIIRPGGDVLKAYLEIFPQLNKE